MNQFHVKFFISIIIAFSLMIIKPFSFINASLDPSNASSTNAIKKGKSKSKPLRVKINNDSVRIAFKYNKSSDMWIDFAKGGANSIFGISHFYLLDNDNKVVDSDFTKNATLFKYTGTDWIGPYIVRAHNYSNSNLPAFTGGFHGYTGGALGSPTARTVSYTIKSSDGKDFTIGKVVSSYKVIITVVNKIQGYNTKQIDGSGREILQETVVYTIQDGKIDVTNEIQAIEDVTIEKYYGLQTVNQNTEGSINYSQGSSSTPNWKNAFKINSDSGSKLMNPEIDRYNLVSNDGMHNLIAWIDRDTGLGSLENVSDYLPVCFTMSYGKSYFNLINGTHKTLLAGQKINWHGGYKFIYGKQ